MKIYRLSIVAHYPASNHDNEILTQNFSTMKSAVRTAWNFSAAVSSRAIGLFKDDQNYSPNIPFLSDKKGMKSGNFNITVENNESNAVVAVYQIRTKAVEIMAAPMKEEEIKTAYAFGGTK